MRVEWELDKDGNGEEGHFPRSSESGSVNFRVAKGVAMSDLRPQGVEPMS